MKAKFDLSIVAANIPTGSNNTTRRVDWITLMAANEPWYMKEIPTMFISFCNPYHMIDVPFISTFVNCYSSSEFCVQAAVDKLMGRSDFGARALRRLVRRHLGRQIYVRTPARRVPAAVTAPRGPSPTIPPETRPVVPEICRAQPVSCTLRPKECRSL